MKTKTNNNNLISLRLDKATMDALKDMEQHGFCEKGGGNAYGLTKAKWLRFHLNMNLLHFLVPRLNLLQILSYSTMAELYLMYVKAERGEEGYAFTTNNKETRCVVAPDGKVFGDKTKDLM